MLTIDKPTGLPLLGQDDGGLAIRQMFRQVKERMEHRDFRRTLIKMNCRECVEQKTRKPSVNVRAYRTWGELRLHLISHHGYDSRVVPE